MPKVYHPNAAPACIALSARVALSLALAAIAAAARAAAPAPVESAEGMVVTAQHLASEAGAAVLRQGETPSTPPLPSATRSR